MKLTIDTQKLVLILNDLSYVGNEIDLESETQRIPANEIQLVDAGDAIDEPEEVEYPIEFECYFFVENGNIDTTNTTAKVLVDGRERVAEQTIIKVNGNLSNYYKVIVPFAIIDNPRTWSARVQLKINEDSSTVGLVTCVVMPEFGLTINGIGANESIFTLSPALEFEVVGNYNDYFNDDYFDYYTITVGGNTIGPVYSAASKLNSFKEILSYGKLSGNTTLKLDYKTKKGQYVTQNYTYILSSFNDGVGLINPSVTLYNLGYNVYSGTHYGSLSTEGLWANVESFEDVTITSSDFHDGGIDISYSEETGKLAIEAPHGYIRPDLNNEIYFAAFPSAFSFIGETLKYYLNNEYNIITGLESEIKYLAIRNDSTGEILSNEYYTVNSMQIEDDVKYTFGLAFFGGDVEYPPSDFSGSFALDNIKLLVVMAVADTWSIVRESITNGEIALLSTISAAAVSGEYFSFTDYSIQPGELYNYFIVYEVNGSLSSSVKSAAIAWLPEDMTLMSQKKILPVRYNPDLTSYKFNYADTVTPTLGGVYPIIRRNGRQKYRTMQIGGLISYNAELDCGDLVQGSASLDSLFVGHQTNSPQAAAAMFLTQSELQAIKNNTSYSQYEKEALLERVYRDRVLAFLHDGQPKVFRSLAEGGMIVKLSNISLTGNKQLDRNIYSFTATATEIAEYTLENMRKYGLIPNG